MLALSHAATVVIVILVALLILGGLPGTRERYGWAPSGLLGTVLVVVLILYLLGCL